MKQVTLPPYHYAFSWKSAVRSNAETNQLAIEYATLPDDDPAKQDKLLELCQCFHQYLMKYLVMICRGHVPLWGTQARKGRINGDSLKFIKYFLPKVGSESGEEVTKAACLSVCRHLHLAFKTRPAAEIYDILMEQLLAAIRRYDPHYSDKTRLVVETLNGKLQRFAQFTIDDINRLLDFDAASHVRMFDRRGHLASVKEGGRITAYRRESWPPPDSLYTSGPVGFTYYLQTWFRYYLQQWIDASIRELETKEGVYSLDCRGQGGDSDASNGAYASSDLAIPDADNDFRDTNGRSWAVDNTLATRSLDTGTMSLQWVESTTDPLFRDLDRSDRRLLYLQFARGMSFKELAGALGITEREAKRLSQQILSAVRAKACHQDAA